MGGKKRRRSIDEMLFNNCENALERAFRPYIGPPEDHPSDLYNRLCEDVRSHQEYLLACELEDDDEADYWP